jgi:hypothetical protein
VPEKESTSLSCRHTSESSIILSFFRKTHTQYTCVSKCKNSAWRDYVCPVEKYINSSTSEHFSPLPFSFILGNSLSPGHEQKANGQDICSALSLLDFFLKHPYMRFPSSFLFPKRIAAAVCGRQNNPESSYVCVRALLLFQESS